MADSQSTNSAKILSMWSCPRSLSTVLYLSFSQLPTVKTFDEPLVFYWFKSIGYSREGVDEYINSDESSKEKHLRRIFHTDFGKPVHYIKNMCLHWDGVEEEYFEKMEHSFLIREPVKVVSSYLKRQPCKASTFAYDRMWELYNKAVKLGQEPIVIDSDEMRKDPKAVLTAFCKLSGVEYDDCMLSWEPGAREEQIVLPNTWYDVALKSTGFKPLPENPEETVIDESYQHIVDEMQVFYDKLKARSLTVEKARQILAAEDAQLLLKHLELGVSE